LQVILRLYKRTEPTMKKWDRIINPTQNSGIIIHKTSFLFRKLKSYSESLDLTQKA
jgi:hypothetical protein